MVRGETVLKEMLSDWPTENWKTFMRDVVQKGRHCIIPEVSRVHVSVAPEVARPERSEYDEHVLPVFWNQWRQRVHLGDVRRMISVPYERVIYNAWPGLE